VVGDPVGQRLENVLAYRIDKELRVLDRIATGHSGDRPRLTPFAIWKRRLYGSTRPKSLAKTVAHKDLLHIANAQFYS